MTTNNSTNDEVYRKIIPESTIEFSNKSCHTRILKEYKYICNEIQSSSQAEPQKFYYFISESNIQKWKVIIRGEPDSIYNGLYLLSVEFPDNYPYAAPKVRFETNVYHCNIGTEGSICCIDEMHCPALSISKLLISINALLCNPNPAYPLDKAKADQYTNDRNQYNENVRHYNQLYANNTLEELMQFHSLF